MVGLTFRFLKALHPGVREEDIQHQRGIVFIDEIDAHLHPVWQQRILQMFRDTFPNVQFVVTAHTPLVIAGCKRREVSVLKKTPSGFVVNVLDEHFIGARAVSLYKKVFEVEDKDLTYLRLITRQGERRQLEERRAHLETKSTRSSAEQEDLDALDLQLYYLDEVERINNQRDDQDRLHRERQRLELDVKNLSGHVAELESRLGSAKRPGP